MKIKVQNILFVVLMLVFYSCESSTDSNNENQNEDQTVNVQIDLQYGFNDHSILLKFNGIEYYRAVLNNSVPIVGPIATFTTALPRGDVTCYVFWMQLNTPELVWFDDSLEIYLGDSDQYYLGYTIYHDTLNIVVQDSMFYYM